jgi:hypothetical protein
MAGKIKKGAPFRVLKKRAARRKRIWKNDFRVPKGCVLLEMDDGYTAME